MPRAPTPDLVWKARLPLDALCLKPEDLLVRKGKGGWMLVRKVEVDLAGDLIYRAVLAGQLDPLDAAAHGLSQPRSPDSRPKRTGGMSRATWRARLPLDVLGLRSDDLLSRREYGAWLLVREFKVDITKDLVSRAVLAGQLDPLDAAGAEFRRPRTPTSKPRRAGRGSRPRRTPAAPLLRLVK